MKKCPNCGNDVADEVKFCPDCGYKFEEGSSVDEASAEAQNVETEVDAQNVENEATSTADEEQKVEKEAAPVEAQNAEAEATSAEVAGTEATTAAPDAANADTTAYTYVNQGIPQEKDAKSGKKLGKGLIAAIVAIVVALVAVIAVVASGAFGSVNKKFLQYNAQVITDHYIKNYQTYAEKVEKKDISTDITITADTDMDEINTYLDGSAITLKVKGDQENLSSVVELGVNVMGSELLTGDVTFEDGKLGFYLPSLDENYYVADADTFLSTITGEDITYFQSIMDQKGKTALTTKETVEMAQAYLDIAYQIATKSNVKQEKNVDISTASMGDFKGTLYTCTPTGEDMSNMLNALADRYENDEQLKSIFGIIEEMSEYNDQVLGSYGSSSQIADAFEDSVEELRDLADSALEEFEEGDFVWTVGVENGKTRMIRFEDEEGSAIELNISGNDDAKTSYIVSVDGEDLLSNIYEATDKGYEGSFLIYSDGEAVGIDYEIEKDSYSNLGLPVGTYSISVPDANGVGMSLTVEKKDSEDLHTLAITSDDVNLNLYIASTDTSSVDFPSVEPTDITDYSLDEINDLLESLVNSFSYQLYDVADELGLGSLFGGYGYDDYGYDYDYDEDLLDEEDSDDQENSDFDITDYIDEDAAMEYLTNYDLNEDPDGIMDMDEDEWNEFLMERFPKTTY